MTVRPGTVYLVGAGPGDPHLITVRGLELLQRANVVLHDRLVSAALLEEASVRAQLIDVGKTAWAPAIPQGEINSALISHARDGRIVVRLKGGDPLLFGRGWEEFEACRVAGIPCEIVPGVSSALAGPAAAGIPITCRGVASSVAIIAAQEVTTRQLKLAVHADTAVFLMGMRGLPELAKRLVDCGRNAATPAAVVENATLPGQRVVHARLDEIANVTSAADLASPAIIVVGETAAFGKPSDGPLSGRRIVVTRPVNAAPQLVNSLRALGADVVMAPLIQIRLTDVDYAADLHTLGRYDWIAFSSRHAVRGFRRAVEQAGGDVRNIARARIAAVGPITARELEVWGIRPDLISQPARADALVQLLLAQQRRPERVLFPCGTLALETIPQHLASHGIAVERLVVYETRKLSLDDRARAQIEQGVDALLFASPSAVTAFGESGAQIGSAQVVCIGPTTAAATAAFSWRNVQVADVHTDAGIVAATVASLAPGVSV